ncbi:oleate hydratase [Kamptonema cortianum]|nr:oleate hydratase [Kamptonema cortianum]
MTKKNHANCLGLMHSGHMQGEKCVIVGGGLAGLAAAIRLAHAGMRVVLMEKNATVGGKAGTFSKDGFTWDTGPSLVTMPEILRDLFESVGRKMEDGLTLKKNHTRVQIFLG